MMNSGLRQTILVVALIGLGTSSAYAAETFNDAADVRAITAMENKLIPDTDAQDIASHYAPDAYVEDIVAPGIYRGRKEISAAFGTQLAAIQSMKSEILDMNIASDGTLACAAFRSNFDMTMKDGSHVKMSVRTLDAFRKFDGKWLITQEHLSVPMDAKTGMAVMNAQLPVRSPIEWTADMVPATGISPQQAAAEIRHWVVVGAPVIDIDTMVSYLGPGQEALLYDLKAPGEYHGQKEIHDVYAPLLSQLSSAKVELLNFVVDSDGKFGVQINNQNLLINFKDGTSKVVSYRQSDCVHRVGPQIWSSFFEVLSFPVDTKTGKSVATDPTAFQK
jgi:ketosteroid isomerase-like protein